ncbi:MAG: chromosomal replication initiator protein DnaA [Ruminococcaceae bacterium]|nr:chromosomal replication initiator protein DnaA [Oscillospiraceae bacterium]
MHKIWERALSILKDEVSEIAYKTWFATLSPLEFKNQVFLLSAPNDIHKNMITGKYLPLLLNALEMASDQELQLEIILQEEYIPNVQTQKRHLNSKLNPRYTFEEFVVGENNKYAHAACLAVAENPAKIYNPLFLYGNSGLGKTHLIHSVGHYITENNPDAKVMYVASEKFTNDLINAIKDGRTEEFRSIYRYVDVLMIDDIHFISGKVRAQEELFHCFNTLYEANKQLIFTSDRPPKEIAVLEERIKTRFESGLLMDLQPPDFETRVAILRKKAQSNNIEIPDNIIDLVANTIKSNIRELEGVLKRIHVMKTLSHEPITEDKVTDILRDFFYGGDDVVLSNQEVLKEVSRYFDIPQEEILSKKRTKEIAYVRQIAMYLCREIVGDSLKEVGNFFGKKDHSTVLHACDKIEAEMKKDIELQNQIVDLTKNIKHGN